MNCPIDSDVMDELPVRRMTVRNHTLNVLRGFEVDTIFGNPGSTELALLSDWPEDFRFVLGLHEASATAMAAGWSLESKIPGVAVLHSLPGLANAVGSLVAASENRIPLLIIVGEPDRRHLHLEPFLSGNLDGLGGRHVKDIMHPPLAEAVPTMVSQAMKLALAPPSGPVVVTVPMDDWAGTLPEAGLPKAAGPGWVSVGSPSDSQVGRIATSIESASAPVLVVGSEVPNQAAWTSLVAIAEAARMPVWLEAFSGTAAFPQDHKLFRGLLSGRRTEVEKSLAGHDLIVAVGARTFRYYQYEPISVQGEAKIIKLVSTAQELATDHYDTAYVGDLPSFLRTLAVEVQSRGAHASLLAGRADSAAAPNSIVDASAAPASKSAEEALFLALGRALPGDAVVFGESPSTQALLRRLVPARSYPGFVTSHIGALGFALPASIGMKLCTPERTVLAIIGDGAAMYSPQALWSAVEMRIPVIVIVMSNDGYAILDRASAAQGLSGVPQWGRFSAISPATVAKGFGCPSVELGRISDVVTLVQQKASEKMGALPLLIDFSCS